MSDSAKAILIDDDPLVRGAWLIRAKGAGVTIAVYESADAFRKIQGAVPLSLPIFVDSNLGDGIKGEVFAKELSEKGFTALYLATGYPPSYFKAMPWIKAIVTKDPPDWLFPRPTTPK